jgi:hypothetical protein
MEVLKITKTEAPPVPPVEITHIDVRMTVDEAMLVGGLVARTNGPVGDAIAKNGSLSAASVYRALRDALGLSGFNTNFQCLALTPRAACVGPDGFAVAHPPAPLAQRVRAPTDAGYEMVSEDEASRRLYYQRERIREVSDALYKANSTIKENHAVQGRQAETIAVQTKEIESLRAQNDALRLTIKEFDEAVTKVEGILERVGSPRL